MNGLIQAGKNQIPEIPAMEEMAACDIDNLVLSVFERRRNFLRRLDSWRQSRNECMNDSLDIIPTIKPVIHVKNSKESAVQTDTPGSSTNANSRTSLLNPRIHIECPLISEYLNRCI